MVGFLRIDSNPPSANFSLSGRKVASSVVPGAGIMRCGHIERKDLELLDKQKASQCPNVYL